MRIQEDTMRIKRIQSFLINIKNLSILTAYEVGSKSALWTSTNKGSLTEIINRFMLLINNQLIL